MWTTRLRCAGSVAPAGTSTLQHELTPQGRFATRTGSIHQEARADHQNIFALGESAEDIDRGAINIC